MQAEIITVGTEILLGQINNTNATFIAKQLAQLGVEVHYQTTVGDHIERIELAVKQAMARNNLVIVCGGLGPTADDQTKQAVAQALGTTLITDGKQLEAIQAYFKQRGRQMVESNRKQAMYLKGGLPLANPAGLALGDFYEAEHAVVAVLPGPPRELTAMMTTTLRPLLIKRFRLNHHLVSRYLFFTDISESELMATIEKMVPDDDRISVASYAQPQAIQVRFTSSSDDDHFLATLTKIEEQVKQRFAQYYLGNHDSEGVVSRVVSLLTAQHLTVTAAESLTAGLFQATLCSIGGASSVFRGGFVTYANDVKAQLLKIEPRIIKENGVVSAPIAQLMAERSREIMQTDIGVSFTGVAGPDSLEGQVPGTVWLGLAQAGYPTETVRLALSNQGRQAIREQSVRKMFNLLFHRLN